MGKKLQKKKNRKQNPNQNCNKRRNNSHSDNPNPTESSVLKEKKNDLISSLPDDILCRIILLLPFKCAVQTSFLSTRWRKLWNKALALHGTIEDMAKVITAFIDPFDQLGVLSNHRGLLYHFSQSGILLATLKDNQEFHLNFSDRKKETHEQHFDWYLKLKNCFFFSPLHQLHSCFFSVKILCLTSVNKLTKEAISSLILNFKSLESLKIAKCKGLQSLRIEASFKLRSLTVLDCPTLNEVYIFGYNLQIFRFRGLLPWFHFKTVPHLKDAMLDLRGLGYHPRSEDLFSLLWAARNVEILTLCGSLFEVKPIPKWLGRLTLAGVILGRGLLVFNNLKELWWIDSSMEEHSMDTLVSILKLCPSLERLFITIDPTSCCNTSKRKCRFWTEYSNQVARHTRLDHLGMVKLEGFTFRKDEILLVEHLLNEVVSVEPIIITTLHENGSNRNRSQRFVRTPHCKKKNGPKTQEKYTKRESVSDSSRGYQKKAEQHQEMKYRLEFVEDEYNKICITHPHMVL